MNDIMKIIQFLEDSYILLKGVTKTIKNERKEQKEGFLSMLVGTLGGSLLGNLLTVKRILRTGYGRPLSSALQKKKRKRNFKSWYWKRMGFLIPTHSLTNFEIQKYYKNEPRFSGVFSTNNLPRYNSIEKK